MGYAIRLFCTVPLSSLIPLQAQLLQRGFQVQPVGTNQLDIIFDREKMPLTVDLIEAHQQETQLQIADFLEDVSKLSDSPAQRKVIEVLAHTQSLVIIGVEEDGSDAFKRTLDYVLDVVSHAADGLFQVDGEGFYEGGNLLLPLK